MRLTTEPTGETRLFFGYPNAAPAPVRLWIARPPDCTTQTEARVEEANRAPIESLALGMQWLDCYLVPQFRTLRLAFAARRLSSRLDRVAGGGAPQLGAEERARCLGASVQLPRDPAIDAEARRLTAGATNSLEAAHRLFRELTANYRYTYPVRRRGAMEMLRAKQGDCGEFVALFVALCRASGIPARPVVGTLLAAHPGSGHVWAELWIEEVGWVPADPSRAQALLLYGKNPDALFAQSDGKCFAFSLGMDLPLADRFGPPVRPATMAALVRPRVSFGGRKLRWGFETVAGAVPYFQPAYPRSYSGCGPQALSICPAVGCWTATRKRLRWLLLHAQLLQLPVWVATVGFVVAGSFGENVAVSLGTAAVVVLYVLLTVLLGLSLQRASSPAARHAADAGSGQRPQDRNRPVR